MARGSLTRYQTAYLPFVVNGFGYDGVIDTGFTGGISFPRSWLPPSGVAVLRSARFELPDGSEVYRDVYGCEVEIDGGVVRREMIFTGPDEILIGADVLRHFVLTINYPAGTVTLVPPSAPPG